MRRFLAIAVLLAGTLGMGGCGSGSTDVKNPKTDTSTDMGPAPDNNAATNPSLADTGFEKNRARPVTDSAKRK
ncbi:MAG TPA: hypothetical protein VFE32_13675 [Puia sp.]|jgi:hypothetical protein|nr:hypothetical protein [Puia sp.]